MKTERVKKKRKKIHCDIAPLSDSFHRRTPCAESPLFGLSTIDPQPTRELGRKEFGVLHRRNVGQGKGLPHGEDRWVPCFVQGFRITLRLPAVLLPWGSFGIILCKWLFFFVTRMSIINAVYSVLSSWILCIVHSMTHSCYYTWRKLHTLNHSPCMPTPLPWNIGYVHTYCILSPFNCLIVTRSIGSFQICGDHLPLHQSQPMESEERKRKKKKKKEISASTVHDITKSLDPSTAGPRKHARPNRSADPVVLVLP